MATDLRSSLLTCEGRVAATRPTMWSISGSTEAMWMLRSAALAQRFAVSYITCELLIRSLQADASLAKIVREAYAAICAEAEDAVSNTLKGLPGEAAKLLLDRADITLNAKLMDLAIHTIDRHGQSIEGVEALRDRATALHKRYRSYGTQVRLNGAKDLRSLVRIAKR